MIAQETGSKDRVLRLILPMLLIIILALIGYIYINRPQSAVKPEIVPSIVVRQVQSVSELTTAIVNTEAVVPINVTTMVGFSGQQVSCFMLPVVRLELESI